MNDYYVFFIDCKGNNKVKKVLSSDVRGAAMKAIEEYGAFHVKMIKSKGKRVY